jgi:hypothetical protein
MAYRSSSPNQNQNAWQTQSSKTWFSGVRYWNTFIESALRCDFVEPLSMSAAFNAVACVLLAWADWIHLNLNWVPTWLLFALPRSVMILAGDERRGSDYLAVLGQPDSIVAGYRTHCRPVSTLSSRHFSLASTQTTPQPSDPNHWPLIYTCLDIFVLLLIDNFALSFRTYLIHIVNASSLSFLP